MTSTFKVCMLGPSVGLTRPANAFPGFTSCYSMCTHFFEDRLDNSSSRIEDVKARICHSVFNNKSLSTLQNADIANML